MAAVLLVAGRAGDLGDWSGHRRFDALLGRGMALASMYLRCPRDKPDDDTIQ